jgi:hypothetical protein
MFEVDVFKYVRDTHSGPYKKLFRYKGTVVGFASASEDGQVYAVAIVEYNKEFEEVPINLIKRV